MSINPVSNFINPLFPGLGVVGAASVVSKVLNSSSIEAGKTGSSFDEGASLGGRRRKKKGDREKLNDCH